LEKVKCQQNGKQGTYCLYSEKERFQVSEELLWVSPLEEFTPRY
jgi:hypothetical protein